MWSSKRAVLAAVSFSKVTVACIVSPLVEIVMSLIFPLSQMSVSIRRFSAEVLSLPEAEEVLDLLLTCGRTDVLDIDSVCRHVDGCNEGYLIVC